MGVEANNDANLHAAIGAALVRLRQIQNQAATFQAQAPYGALTLANLNDLLSKSQLITAAVADIATDLIGLARITSSQYDGTT